VTADLLFDRSMTYNYIVSGTLPDSWSEFPPQKALERIASGAVDLEGVAFEEASKWLTGNGDTLVRRWLCGFDDSLLQRATIFIPHDVEFLESLVSWAQDKDDHKREREALGKMFTHLPEDALVQLIEHWNDEMSPRLYEALNLIFNYMKGDLKKESQIIARLSPDRRKSFLIAAGNWGPESTNTIALIRSRCHGVIPIEEAAHLAVAMKAAVHYGDIFTYIDSWDRNEVARYCNQNPWFLRRILRGDDYGWESTHLRFVNSVVYSRDTQPAAFAATVLHSSYVGGSKEKSIASTILEGESEVARYVRRRRSEAQKTLASLAMNAVSEGNLARAIKAWLLFDSELEEQLVRILRLYANHGEHSKTEFTALLARVLMAREGGATILSSLERGKFLVMLNRVMQKNFEYNSLFPRRLDLWIDLIDVQEGGVSLYSEAQLLQDLRHNENGAQLVKLGELTKQISYEMEDSLVRYRPVLLRLAFTMKDDKFYFSVDSIIGLLRELQEGQSRERSSKIPLYSLIFLRDTSGEFIVSAQQRAAFYNALTGESVAWALRNMIDLLEDHPGLASHFKQQDVVELFRLLRAPVREAALKAKYTPRGSNFSDPILYSSLVEKLKGVRELRLS